MATTNIDIHHHMLPAFYVDWLAAQGHDTSELPEWTPEASLAMLDATGVEKAILSVPSPVALEPSMARRLNDEAARLVHERPDRFGAFACLPVGDVEASVREVERALDELRLDGVILLSSVGGTAVGSPGLEPILAALDARGATLFVHGADRPGIDDHDVFDAFLEYPTDVARAYTRLVAHHAFTRFRDVRFVFANGGGGVPFLAERIGKLYYMKGTKPRWGRILVDLVRKKNGGLDLARSVSYEVADACSRFTLAGLRQLVEPDQILFGSGFPFASVAMATRSLEQLRAA